ncbi:MAG: hypothetical protein HY530_06085 [Chloroflexi bacterium]|nr:hypothetical protein [Chloroflexota bacterium]
MGETILSVAIPIGMIPVNGVYVFNKGRAKRLRLSQDHVRPLARKGLLKAQKLGHDWVVLDLNYTRKRKVKGGKK